MKPMTWSLWGAPLTHGRRHWFHGEHRCGELTPAAGTASADFLRQKDINTADRGARRPGCMSIAADAAAPEFMKVLLMRQRELFKEA